MRCCEKGRDKRLFFLNSRNRLAFQEKREVYCVTAAHHDFFELVMTITDTLDDYLLSILLKKGPQGPRPKKE